MLASKWNCLEVNREEVLTEYSYLSNIGKSSVILSSYIKLVSLLFTCIYLQNAGLSYCSTPLPVIPFGRNLDSLEISKGTGRYTTYNFVQIEKIRFVFSMKEH